MRRFAWPTFDGPFNWAIDWFDAISRGNASTALHIVEEDGSSARYSFDALARRSDQVAAWLGTQGVAQGDRVVLMLGNQVELWECMLAVAKLGAVIMPTTLAVGTAELVDRIERGGARHVVTNAAETAKFDELPGGYGRIAVGPPVPGWRSYADAAAIEAGPSPHPGTLPGDPLLVYFTSDTTSRPKLVEHTQVSYPVGHLSTMYWIGLRPGNVPGELVKPGSMGRPLPGVPVVLVDPVTGAPADEGEIYLDLAAHPVALMTGYLGDAERNAEAMAGGYYHTGDVATRDADGYLTYVGRTDDVFKASDYKVSPFELESVLIEHPAVVEAAVVPAPDPIRLTVPRAYVALSEGVTGAQTHRSGVAHRPLVDE